MAYDNMLQLLTTTYNIVSGHMYFPSGMYNIVSGHMYLPSGMYNIVSGHMYLPSGMYNIVSGHMYLPSGHNTTSIAQAHLILHMLITCVIYLYLL